MSAQRILHAHVHLLARPVVIISPGIDQRHLEVIQLHERAGDRLTGAGGYRGTRRLVTSWPEETGLQRVDFLVARADMGKIARGGMATGAMRGKKGLTLLGIAGCAGSLTGVLLGVEAPVGRQINLQVQIFRDVVDLLGCQTRERWHASLRPAVLDDGADRFTFFIMENGGGPQQIGPLSAPCIFAMARSAVVFKQSLTFLRRCLVRRRSEAEKCPDAVVLAGAALLLRMKREQDCRTH